MEKMNKNKMEKTEKTKMEKMNGQGMCGIDTKRIYRTMAAGLCLLVFLSGAMNVSADPIIDIVKIADKHEIIAGGSVTYTYVVTNVGNHIIYNLNVTDDKLGYICGKDNLSIGANMTCNATTILNETTTNVATVQGCIGIQCGFLGSDNETVVVISEPVVVEMRTIGFWKHQFAVAVKKNKGHAQIDSTILVSYLPITVFGNNISTIDEGYTALWLKKAPMQERAIQQCFASRLNYKNNNGAIGDTLVDTDYDGIPDMTFNKAMDVAEESYNNGDYEEAKDICDSINNM